MTILDDIIDDATNDAVSAASLLRKVKVVAARIGASDLRAWADREIAGYSDGDDLPHYRARQGAPVMGTWSSMRGEMKVRISFAELSDEWDPLFFVDFRQSVAEIAEWMQADKDPAIAWPTFAVQRYNKLVGEGKAPGWAYNTLAEAHTMVRRQAMAGVIEAVRSTVLDFALDLQAADPESGRSEGPTIAKAEVAEAAQTMHFHIYGNVGNLAVGDNAHQGITIEAGDGEALLAALRASGASDALVAEVGEALAADESAQPSRFQTVAASIRAGTLAVAQNAAASITADAALALFNQYLAGGLPLG